MTATKRTIPTTVVRGADFAQSHNKPPIYHDPLWMRLEDGTDIGVLEQERLMNKDWLRTMLTEMSLQSKHTNPSKNRGPIAAHIKVVDEVERGVL